MGIAKYGRFSESEKTVEFLERDFGFGALVVTSPAISADIPLRRHMAQFLNR